ncbi:TOR complex subunit lst8 [Exophiala xenobiotica]|uniref:Target of rapamycin complex subunit LST8 n=1 Tax=Lithohypha guttulata TaxID=1690604 RepID=A0ABR0KAD2_9EURO|nr:TOR complex subunit lst8 [Lithohypha guttulata]KAK5318864.1 TOR complex subunit lst8 [Exophiala xenobiotica]
MKITKFPRERILSLSAELATRATHDTDCLLVSAGYDHTIRFWEALSGICSRTIQHPESQVNRLCITPDKKYLAAAGRHMVRLYDIKSSNPSPIMVFEGHSNNITAVAFHVDTKWMVTSSEDSTVKVWDTRTGNIQRNYAHSHPVNDVVIHPNQGEIVSADRGGNVRVFDLGSDKCTHQLIPAEDVSVSSVSVANDGSLLAAGNNHGDVYIWRMYQENNETSLAPCRVFKAHKEYLTRLLLSPDIKLLATCSADHTVKVWRVDPNFQGLEDFDQETEYGSSPQTPIQTSHSLPTTTFSSSVSIRPNTSSTNELPSQSSTISSLSAGSASTGHLPNSQIPQPIITHRRPLPLETTLENHQRWVWDCAFSADSAYLVTVCSDHYARLWELASSSVIRQYSGHHRGAVCVALNDYSGAAA